MRFTIFQDSRQGDRQGNEDRIGYSYSRDVLLMTVADGMGGHIDGEVAAEIAVTEITRRFQHEARQMLKKPVDFLVSAQLPNAWSYPRLSAKGGCGGWIFKVVKQRQSVDEVGLGCGSARVAEVDVTISAFGGCRRTGEAL